MYRGCGTVSVQVIVQCVYRREASHRRRLTRRRGCAPEAAQRGGSSKSLASIPAIRELAGRSSVVPIIGDRDKGVRDKAL